ncbi:hypothetical protein RIF29_34393 [Crotalaria pallida]|uniref:Uncharacterized protein n=1 Tax=Crotalaria pallida TaxID=3830 RepID=A0AAN9E8W0_CROPI
MKGGRRRWKRRCEGVAESLTQTTMARRQRHGSLKETMDSAAKGENEDEREREMRKYDEKNEEEKREKKNEPAATKNGDRERTVGASSRVESDGHEILEVKKLRRLLGIPCRASAVLHVSY